MALESSGNLLVRLGGDPVALAAFATEGPAAAATPTSGLAGFALEPLFSQPAGMLEALGASQAPPEARWMVAAPPGAPSLANPWDQAHAAARSDGYAHYIEPDLIHARRLPPERALEGPAALTEAVSSGGFDGDWRPHKDEGAGPAWHLQPGYTGFLAVREQADGAGVRIAHLDTGYTPDHMSTPRNMRADLAWDYARNQAGAVDPGTGMFDGHGTATLALLAGREVSLRLRADEGGLAFMGEIGGAPGAEIVPVRISGSVIHIKTVAMARGLDHALTTGCDVVSLSHGGLPLRSWATAVNRLYDAGVIVAAASGDSFYFKVITLATRYTVYPAAFNRVITVLGATHDKQPYITEKFGEMQGCWGPDSVMWKAIAGYTPNVAWMDYKRPQGFGMTGAGTSSSTPQVAAACALWLQLYGDQYDKDWRRVEACRLALFGSAAENLKDHPRLGWGLLDVPTMLQADRAQRIKALMDKGEIDMSAKDSVRSPLFRLLRGLGPPDSEKERMYEAEVAQVALGSESAELIQFGHRAWASGDLSRAEVAEARALLLAEDISDSLREALREAA